MSSSEGFGARLLLTGQAMPEGQAYADPAGRSQRVDGKFNPCDRELPTRLPGR
jgi:hypothetical protein